MATGGFALAYGGPTLWGAFSGELVGGYSAYRSGGNILSGVLVGGVAGGLTGYVGAQAGTGIRDVLGESRLGYVLAGMARGGIVGTGGGGVAAYAGGRGNYQSIIRGMYRGMALGVAAGGVMGYIEFSPGEQLSEISTRDHLKRSKEAILDLGKKAVQSGKDKLDIMDFAQAMGRKFITPVINSLAANPDVGYSVLSTGVGVQETDYLLESYYIDHGFPERKIERRF